MGFCFDLKYEVEDLEETWDFTKKENLESDDEEEEEATPGLKEVKELTYEDIEKVNNALIEAQVPHLLRAGAEEESQARALHGRVGDHRWLGTCRGPGKQDL